MSPRSSATAASTSPEAFLRAARDDSVFSGAAWSVGTTTGPTFRGVLGTLAWDGEPVAEDTLWDLASVTKPVAALAAMALLERGQLALSDPISAYLPDYAGSDKADISLWHLLTHTSGIPGQQPLYRRHADRDGMLTALRQLPLRHPPGTEVAYSSPGFMILGLVAEAVAGQSLDALVRETVTRPAAMSDTGFNPPAQDRARAAATEDCSWRGQVVQGTVHDENAHALGGVAAHAGLFAPLGDVERLALALLRDGAGEAGPILAPRTLAVMTRPATDHLNLRRCLGWQGTQPAGAGVGDLFSPRAYGHTGFTGTSVWVDPDLGVYSVLLTNRVHPRRGSSAMARLRPKFHNLALTQLLRPR
ncbi:serine hydrolase domain-containing protein [Actinopolymorpha sp. B9G3]|uniref:serine hydrolase domain-containing protein n=1 Tax=Actinopolymorpha sp. B9G3 TaxID=3158970 RepID=UPI0032D94EA1